MQFVDVKNDVAFHKIFGNENKKIILISFLNAVMQLKGKDRIAEIALMNPFQVPILPNFKASILDLKATDKNKNTYIVEMQVADATGMDKRLLYYTSKEYSQQIKSGEKYTELYPVIFIGIFDFYFTKGYQYLSHHAICNIRTGERVIKDMDFYFIELPRFNKKLEDLQTVTDKWIYFIKEVKNLSFIPDNVSDEGLRNAYEDAHKSTWTISELDAYERIAIRTQDDRGRLQLAEQRAEQKGMERGLEKGIEKGLEKGLKQKEIEAVLGFYKIGVEISKIAEAMNIPLEKVVQIVAEFNE